MERYLHSISLLLLMVAIAVSLLEVLALASARYDLALSRRQENLLTANQELQNEAEEALSTGGFRSGRSDLKFSDEDGHSLRLVLERRGDVTVITQRKSITEWKEDRRIGNLIHTGETGEEQ